MVFSFKLLFHAKNKLLLVTDGTFCRCFVYGLLQLIKELQWSFLARREYHGKVRELNDRLMMVERALTDRDGLTTRPWYKHLVCSPVLPDSDLVIFVLLYLYVYWLARFWYLRGLDLRSIETQWLWIKVVSRGRWCSRQGKRC